MPTNGDDFLFSQGFTTQLTITLLNPYTDEEIEIIDEEYRFNTGVYDGKGGNDTLLMSNLGDALFIRNEEQEQVVISIETIFAGSGGDLIILADPTIQYGDVTIFGAEGDDIIWSNVGNDFITGSQGDDIIDGGPGNDEIQGNQDNDRLNGGQGDDNITGGDGTDLLYGDAGNDRLNGGEGSDLLSGGSGNDTLLYSGDEIWPTGFVAWNVGSPDAVINGDRVVVNPRFRNHDGFDGGDGTDTLVMGDSSEALFLDDRYSDNPFGFNTARLRDVEIIQAGGGDDIIDLTSKQFSYGDVRIEGGDGNDVLWGNAGNDTIIGGQGDDHMDGGSGNDIFVVGEGRDEIFGRGGQDTIIYDFLDSQKDIIYGFNASRGGDVLNIADILDGYNGQTDDIFDFVALQQNGRHTDLLVNADGQGTDFITIASFANGLDTSLQNMINYGNLEVEQSVVV